MLAANPIFPRPTFSASSARLPSTSGRCLSSCSSAPPRSVGCQLSAVSSPATPFPATLSGKSQLIENPAALSPFPATLTRHLRHNPFVCRSYKKHPGGGRTFQPANSFRNLTTRHSPITTKSFTIRTSEKPTRNPFGIRTSKTQHLKPFRIRTYEKRRVGVTSFRPKPPLPSLGLFFSPGRPDFCERPSGAR